MSDYQKYVTNDRTTDNSRMRSLRAFVNYQLCGHSWHIFGNRTSQLVILLLYGNENLTEAQNVDIFTAVQTFIRI